MQTASVNAAVKVNASFKVMTPPPGMSKMSPHLYRAHARELIDRIGKDPKPDLALGTKAEVVMLLSEQSLLAPPPAQHAALYEKLFAEICWTLPGEPLREPWPKASEELLGQLRKRAGIPRAKTTP